MGNGESLAGDGVDVLALQLLPRGEADGVNDAVQSVPVLGQSLECCIDLLVAGDIQWQDQVGFALARQVCDPGLKFLGLVGEGELRPLAMHGLCYAVGDGAVAGNAGDEHPFVL